MKNNPFVAILTASASMLALAPGSASAQSLDDKVWLEASAFWPKIDSDMHVAETANPDVSTHIDLESDMGLDNDSVLPAFLAGVRIGSNFAIVGEYYSIGRDASKTLDRDIIYDGVTYPVNGTVKTDFSTDVYRLTLNYAFLRGDNYEVGGAIGLHATDFKVSIEGNGSTDQQGFQFERREQSFLAPMPTLGLFGTYEIAPKVTLSARADYLSLSSGDYDGRLLNTQAKVSYRFMPNIGAGLGYRYVDYRVDVEKEKYEGRFEYKFYGPAIFLEAGF